MEDPSVMTSRFCADMKSYLGHTQFLGKNVLLITRDCSGLISGWKACFKQVSLKVASNTIGDVNRHVLKSRSNETLL